jgi:hypothetical protein
MLDAPNCDWDTGKEAALRIDPAGTIAYTRASARSSDRAQVTRQAPLRWGETISISAASPTEPSVVANAARSSPSADVVECDFETMLRERGVTRRCNC